MSSNAKTYHISVERTDAEGERVEFLASAYGDIDLVGYVGRKVGKALKEAPAGGQYFVNIVETDGICGDEARTVITVTADADLAAYALNQKIRAERATVESITTPETGEPLLAE